MRLPLVRVENDRATSAETKRSSRVYGTYVTMVMILIALVAAKFGYPDRPHFPYCVVV